MSKTPEMPNPADGLSSIFGDMINGVAPPEVTVYNMLLVNLRGDRVIGELLLDLLKKSQAKDALDAAVFWLDMILETMIDPYEAHTFMRRFHKYAMQAAKGEA